MKKKILLTTTLVIGVVAPFALVASCSSKTNGEKVTKAEEETEAKRKEEETEAKRKEEEDTKIEADKKAESAEQVTEDVEKQTDILIVRNKNKAIKDLNQAIRNLNQAKEKVINTKERYLFSRITEVDAQRANNAKLWEMERINKTTIPDILTKAQKKWKILSLQITPASTERSFKENLAIKTKTYLDKIKKELEDAKTKSNVDDDHINDLTYRLEKARNANDIAIRKLLIAKNDESRIQTELDKVNYTIANPSFANYKKELNQELVEMLEVLNFASSKRLKIMDEWKKAKKIEAEAQKEKDEKTRVLRIQQIKNQKVSPVDTIVATKANQEPDTLSE